MQHKLVIFFAVVAAVAGLRLPEAREVAAPAVPTLATSFAANLTSKPSRYRSIEIK